MTHYSSAPRRGWIMVHHTGSPNSFDDTTTNYCDAGYDFHIRKGGAIVTCSRWDDSHGAHARGCNCQTMGIMLNGCFGGCSYGNTAQPSTAQECSLAYLWHHLGTPLVEGRLRPHRACYYWNPCNDPSPTSTVCCGTNLTTSAAGNHRWNSNGVSFRNRVMQKVSYWGYYGRCEPGGQ